MRRPKLTAALAVALGSAVLLRRRRPSERVDLHYDDGAMISLTGPAPQAERLVWLARAVLRAAA